MSYTFLRIDNTFFHKGTSIFNIVGTEGFLIYSYLLYIQGDKEETMTTLKMIQEHINKDYNKRCKIDYRGKESYVSTTKKKDTIERYMRKLESAKLIQIKNKDKDEKIRLNDILEIEIVYRECKKGFTKIPYQLLNEYGYKLGHIGFSLMCILSNLHNRTYGNKYNNGFANPSMRYLAEVLDKNKETILVYINLLQQQKLINIDKQENVVIINDCGNKEATYVPNHYEVKWKSKSNDNVIYLK